MPAFNRFNAWTDTMVESANCGTDQFAIALTNTAPSASNTVLADITEIAYTGFGSRNLTTTSSTQTGGVYSLVWASLTLGTTVTSATFRYVVIYDDTLAGDPLVGWYDLGAGTTIPANTSLILSGMGLDLDGSFDPASLFGVSDQGLAVDFSDSSLIFQSNLGSGAITSANDPIGYVTDLSGKGNHPVQATAGNKPLWRGTPRTLGSEVLTNGRLAADTDWTKGTGWTITAPAATKTAGTASVLSQAITVTAGQTYMLSYTLTRSAGTITPQITGGTTVALTAKSAGGTFSEIFAAVTGNTTIEFSADATFAGTVKSISLKPVTAFSNMGAYQFGSPRRIIAPSITLNTSDKLTVICSHQMDQTFAATTLVGVGNWATTNGTAWVGYGPPPVGRIRGDTSSGSIALAASLVAQGNGAIDFVDCHEFDLSQTALSDEVKITTAGVLQSGTPSGSAGGGGNWANSTIDIGFASARGITGRVIVINRLLTTAEKASAVRWVKKGRVFGCTLGDSTTAWLSGANFIASRTSSFVGGFVSGAAELAESGRKIADMKSFWTALADKSALDVVMIQIGLNDVKGRVGENTATTADVIADLQDLVDTVNADKPVGCKTYICGLTPCKAWLNLATNPTAAYAAWQDVNTAIAGGGSTPITGVDGRITSHVAALNDGSDNLQAIYDFFADGVHPSNEARWINAQAWRDQLEADGLV